MSAQVIESPRVVGGEAPEAIEVVVRQKHIDQGWPMSGQRCAVAMALIGAGYEWVHVGPGFALIDGRRYEGGREFDDWLLAFDRRQEVHPERFVLRRRA